MKERNKRDESKSAATGWLLKKFHIRLLRVEEGQLLDFYGVITFLTFKCLYILGKGMKLCEKKRKKQKPMIKKNSLIHSGLDKFFKL